MDKKQKILIALVITVMGLIFYFSNQIADTSEDLSKGIIYDIVNKFNLAQGKTQNQKEELILQLNKIERKIAHYTIYTLLGIMLFLLIINIKKENKKAIIITIIIGAIYATTDEIHQIFIDGRTALITDVMLDTLGVTTGGFISMLIIGIYNKIKGNKEIKG